MKIRQKTNEITFFFFLNSKIIFRKDLISGDSEGVDSCFSRYPLTFWCIFSSSQFPSNYKRILRFYYRFSRKTWSLWGERWAGSKSVSLFEAPPTLGYKPKQDTKQKQASKQNTRKILNQKDPAKTANRKRSLWFFQEPLKDMARCKGSGETTFQTKFTWFKALPYTQGYG